MNLKRRLYKEVHEEEPLTDREVEEFRQLLQAKKDAIIASLENRPVEKSEGFAPDEIDQAVTEHQNTMAQRFRQRDSGMIKKIDKALWRISEDEYDECETCSDIIAKKRLSARPETSMCISCKEDQEVREAGFISVRLRNEEPAIFTF